MVTGLVPRIGYEKAAAIAKTAYETGLAVREVALPKRILPEDVLKQILEPDKNGGNRDK